MAIIYAIKVYASKIISLAGFVDQELPTGFIAITEEKYNHVKANITPFSRYNIETGELTECTQSIEAYELEHLASNRAYRIKEIQRQRVLLDTLTELEETNEATRQAAVLVTMIAAYKADYPAIIP